MKKAYLLMSVISSLLLVSCSTSNNDKSSKEIDTSKEKLTQTYIDFDCDQNGKMSWGTESRQPIALYDGRHQLTIDGQLCASSFDHTTGTIYYQDYQAAGENKLASKSYLEGNTTSSENVYVFAVTYLTVNSAYHDIFFDAEKSFAEMNDDGLAAKALRVCFMLEDGPFIYAPLQESNKCSYSVNNTMDGSGVRQYGDELIDRSSKAQILLPKGVQIPIIYWLDGNDENLVNGSTLDYFGLFIYFTAIYHLEPGETM